MGASFLITFREALEAALVIGLVLSIIKQGAGKGFSAAVWLGAAAGLAISLAGAWLFNRLAGGFEGPAEMLFEAITLGVGCLLLTSFLLWISHASSRSALEAQIQKAEKQAGAWLGFFLVVLTSVLREGIETVLYLAGIVHGDGVPALIGGLGGIGVAVIVGLLIFVAGKRMPLGRFFGFTNALLVLFGAGLAASLIHELNDIGLVPVLISPLWNAGPEDSLFGNEGAIGGFLHGLFGWSAEPSLSMVVGWGLYLVAVGGTLVARSRSFKKTVAAKA